MYTVSNQLYQCRIHQYRYGELAIPYGVSVLWRVAAMVLYKLSFLKYNQPFSSFALLPNLWTPTYCELGAFTPTQRTTLASPHFHLHRQRHIFICTNFYTHTSWRCQ